MDVIAAILLRAILDRVCHFSVVCGCVAAAIKPLHHYFDVV